MAEPYTGVPEVSPREDVPDSYQHIRADAGSFGGAIAQGLEKLGAGASKAGEFYSQVSADNASNEYQSKVDKILHGDPNARGEDGQPVKGFLQLKGQQAADAWPGVSKQLDEERKALSQTMKTPDQQLRFDNASKRYRSYAINQVGQHADSQYNAWYTDVEQSSAKNAMTHIANNYNNAEEVAHGASDLIQARVQTAQRMGAKPGDQVWNAAVQTAKQEALSAQLEAMAVSDPSRAARVLEKNREIAGTRYDELANKFRTRAELQDGITAGTEAVKKTYQLQPAAPLVMPVLNEAGQKYNVSPDYLLRTHQLDGNGVSETGAKGPFQFTRGTAQQYGLKNPFDFRESADAAAHLAADNRAALTQQLGRLPTDAELYLAHNQDAGGAAKLLKNPTARAGDLVGDEAIRVNGGDPNAPAQNFTAAKTVAFNGAAGAISQARKATAYQTIMENPNMSEGVRRHALQFVNQTIAAQQIAEEADIKARKLANDQAADVYIKRLQNGDYNGISSAITNDQHLTWETRKMLGNIAENKTGNDERKATETFGPGFWGAYKAVLAPSDSPEKITELNALLGRAGPGGDLTLAGVQKLGQVMHESRKSITDSASNQAKLHLMTYAKGKLSFDQELLIPGVPQSMARDPKGEQVFNAQFIPKFEAAYDKWVKDGKDPWAFLNKENVDKMILGMRSQREMAEEKMRATNNLGDLQAPVAMPKGGNVDQSAWNTLTSKPAALKDGTPLTKTVWANALATLAMNPNKAAVEGFNKMLGRDDGAALLKQLTGKDVNAAAAAPVAAPPKPAAPAKSYSIHDKEGAGPAGYLGDLVRKVVPQAAQDYIASKGQ